MLFRSNGTNTLTQGFQQGTLTITQIEEKRADMVNLTVYPNPVQDKLIIKSIGTENKNIKYDIYTVDGKFITKAKINSSDEVIDFAFAPQQQVKQPTGNSR